MTKAPEPLNSSPIGSSLKAYQEAAYQTSDSSPHKPPDSSFSIAFFLLFIPIAAVSRASSNNTKSTNKFPL